MGRACVRDPPLPALSRTALPLPLRARASAALWVPVHKALPQQHALNRITARIGAGGVSVSIMLGPCHAPSRPPQAAPAATRVLCRHHGEYKLPRQRPAYPASSHARTGPAVRHHSDCGLPRQRRGYPASSHASACPAACHHGRREPPWQRPGYPASSHACADPVQSSQPHSSGVIIDCSSSPESGVVLQSLSK